MNAQRKQLEQKLAQESHEKMGKHVELLHAADERSRLADQLRSIRDAFEALQNELANERDKREKSEQAQKQILFDYQQRIEQVFY